VERAQRSALDALVAVTSCVDARDGLPTFFGRLSATIATQLGARRAAFWRLGHRGTLVLHPSPYGFDGDSRIHEVRFGLGAKGAVAFERLVFGDDLDLVDGTSPQLDALWHRVGLTEVTSSIAASWRAGNRRIGAVAVYDAPHGFNSLDLWLLQLTGLAAGLLWLNRESEDELRNTAGRLDEATAARRHLLNNIAAGGDEARRRFASVLHDDSLQLLTGAELQLERIREGSNIARSAGLKELGATLRKVEDSLRRLLTNVSPEPLQLPRDLSEAISERLESMRLRAGIETHNEARLGGEIPDAIQAIVLKNVGEALTNVEKHARATRVRVGAEMTGDGIRVDITDDGTGFVVAESARLPGHIGLVALKERAQLAGGWCRITSEPGTGTRIEFWVPITL